MDAGVVHRHCRARWAAIGAAIAVAVFTLAGAGVLRARFIDTPAWRSAAEMVAVAGGASAAAYGLGALANYAVG